MPWFRPWGRAPPAAPLVSAPVHLLLQEKSPKSSPLHEFRSKRLGRPRPCHACHRLVSGTASCCRVCKYICHEACENKDAERFSDTSWQIHQQWRAGEDPMWPGLVRSGEPHPAPATGVTWSQTNSWRSETPQPQHQRTTPPREAPTSAMLTPAPPSMTHIRHMNEETDGTSGKPRQLELSYAAERLLALWLPAHKGEPPRYSMSPGPERDVANMLNTKHGQHYMVFDVSEQPARAVMEHSGKVCELGWARGLAPPLERLCALCKHLDSWLAAHPANVALLRSCGSRERLAVAVSAYLQYSSICGKQEHALDRCAMRRFLDGTPSLNPSDRRYVEYFAGLLAGGIRVNASPLWLTHITVVGAPPLSHVFLKLYEGMVPIYTSNVYSLGAGARQFTAALGAGPGGVAVRGDVLLRCYRRPPPPAGPHHTRALIFSVQFHTCAVTDYTLVFTKQHLDYACNDEEFPPDGSVEVQIAGGRPAPAPTPAVRVRPADDVLSRWDSLQHLPQASNNTLVNNNHVVSLNNNNNSSGSNNHSHHSEDEEETAAAGRSSGEGPIYATVARRSGGGGAGGGVGPAPSPLSASMDSGISSAGRRQGSPSPGARRRELDELLRDMMRTVEALPGPPAPEDDIPYHARADSRPFAYTAPPDAAMLRCQPHLSSPSLVRRALAAPAPGPAPDPPADLLDRIFDRDPIDTIFTAEANESFRRRERREALGRAASPSGRPQRPPGAPAAAPPPALSPVPPRKEQRLKREEQLTTVTTTRTLPYESLYSGVDAPISREYGTTPRSRNEGVAPITNGQGEADGLTWLQRQQMRLRAHRDVRMRAARISERSLPTRTSASHRFDGYTSDTTAFADDDDDFSVPLHIQTINNRTRTSPTEPLLPNRTSSRKFMSMERRVMRERSISPTGQDMLDSPRDVALLSQNGTMTREESLSSWRSVSVSEWEGNGEGEDSRGATPAFPTTPRTPYPPSATPPPPSHSRLPPRSPVTQRKDFSTLVGRSPPSPIPHPSPTTPVTPELQDVSPDNVKFVRDTSKFWYKPHISRDEAIALLQNQEVGSFIIRDSNSFPNAFGLALKVSAPPGGPAQPSDLVRHFLIDPTSKGVRLKGCADEPVFSSLSALVYQHSVTPLALPAKLKLPGSDPAPPIPGGAARELLAAGAACSVLYIGGSGCEALTGPEAIARTVSKMFPQRPELKPAMVHFKVSAQGITLTDSARKLFFRRHYPTASVSHCGLDPGDRRWSHTTDANGIPSSNRIFGFIARRAGSSTDNECHVFAELEPEQPATAIVNFVSKVMLGQSSANHII